MSVRSAHSHSRVVPILLALGLTLGFSLAALTFLAQTPIAAAHAKYTSSTPAANSTVTAAPTLSRYISPRR